MFNTKIPIYGICILLAITIGLLNINKRSKKKKFKSEERKALIIYVVMGCIFGGKFLTYLLNFQKYKGKFDLLKIGLSSYGSLIGIIFFIILFSYQYKKNKIEMLYIVSSSVPLMYAIGKIGCFFAGCCYGIKYSGPFNIIYKYSLAAPNNISLFPVQLCETISFFLIYLIIINNETKIKKEFLISLNFILCGVFKLFWDFFRNNFMDTWITPNKIISLCFILVGIIMYTYNKTIKMLTIKKA